MVLPARLMCTRLHFIFASVLLRLNHNLGEHGSTIRMNEKNQFTPEAAILWSSVPKDARAKILANAWCLNCRGAVQMIDIKGVEDRGDLILTGKCANCGGGVVRRLETSELDAARN